MTQICVVCDLGLEYKLIRFIVEKNIKSVLII